MRDPFSSGFNLPPGCTTRDIDRAAGDDLDETDTDVPVCALGEAYCKRTDQHRHCNECGATEHADGKCNDWHDRGPIESDDYGKPCPTCPKYGREPGPIDSDSGCCCLCLGDQMTEAMAAPEEDRERWADMAMEPRFPR